MATFITLTPVAGSEISFNPDDEATVAITQGERGTIITSGGLTIYVRETAAEIEAKKHRASMN